MSSNIIRNNRNMGSSWCIPSKLYGITSFLSFSSLLYLQEFKIAIGQGLFSIIWVFILNLLCGEGWTGFSWFILIVTYLCEILFYIKFTSIIHKQVEKINAEINDDMDS